MVRTVLGVIFALLALASFPVSKYLEKSYRDTGSTTTYGKIGWKPYCIKVDELCGYKASYGNEVKLTARFEKTYPFAKIGLQHIALVRMKGKYGYINQHGSFILPAVYQEALPFRDKYAWVRKDKFFSKIDTTGKVLLGTKYEEMRIETEGEAKNVAVYGKGGKFGLINVRNDIVITGAVYDHIGSFSKRAVAPVRLDGKYGIIHFDGRLMVKPGYAKISFPNPDDYKGESYSFARICRAIVEQDGKYDVLNVGTSSFKKDSYKFSPKFDDIKLPGVEGISTVKGQNKFGYFNFDSGQVVMPRFEEAAEMRYHVSVVKKDGKYGLINSRGRLVLRHDLDNPPEFTAFKNGFVLLKVKGKVGLLENGEVKVRPLYDEIKCWQYEGRNTRYFVVRKGEFWGILNNYGAQTTSFEYETMSCANRETANAMKDGKMITIDGYGREQHVAGSRSRGQAGFVDLK